MSAALLKARLAVERDLPIHVEMARARKRHRDADRWSGDGEAGGSALGVAAHGDQDPAAVRLPTGGAEVIRHPNLDHFRRLMLEVAKHSPEAAVNGLCDALDMLADQRDRYEQSLVHLTTVLGVVLTRTSRLVEIPRAEFDSIDPMGVEANFDVPDMVRVRYIDPHVTTGITQGEA